MNELFIEALAFLLRQSLLTAGYVVGGGDDAARKQAEHLQRRLDSLPMLPPPDDPSQNCAEIRAALEDLVAIFPGGGWEAYGIGVKLKRAHEALGHKEKEK